MRYVWEVIIKHPLKKDEDVTMYGASANINIAISRAKKKLKERLNIESDTSDLVVLTAKALHEVEF